MGIRQLLLFALLVVALTFSLAVGWSFWLEDLIDPFLPGGHATESGAERWEFVIVATVMVTMAVGLMLLLGLRQLRALGHRQQIESLAYEGFVNDPVAAFVMDGERTVVAENMRCRELLEPHFGSLVGCSFHELLPIDLTDTRYLDLEMHLRDHGHWRGEFVAHGDRAEVKLEVELTMQRSRSGVATSLHGRVHALEPVAVHRVAPPAAAQS